MLMSISMLSAQLAKMFRLRPKINEWCRSNHVHLLFTVRAKTFLLLRSSPVKVIGFVDFAALDPQNCRNKGGMQVKTTSCSRALNPVQSVTGVFCRSHWWTVGQEQLAVNCESLTEARTLRWKENSRVSVRSILSHSCRLVNPQN